jgi:hypothetical protein
MKLQQESDAEIIAVCMLIYVVISVMKLYRDGRLLHLMVGGKYQGPHNGCSVYKGLVVDKRGHKSYNNTLSTPKCNNDA